MPDRIVVQERAALALARLGLAPPPFPAPFYDAYLGPIAARAVIVAARTGVLRALAERPDDPAGLARRLGLEAEGVRVLLGALVGLGYARCRGERYRLSRGARRWQARLPVTLAELSDWSWRGMGHLEDILRGGAPLPLHERPADDPWWTTYQTAMAEVARFTAEPVAAALPLEAPERLLDLGGGPGLHARRCAGAIPGSRPPSSTCPPPPGSAARGSRARRWPTGSPTSRGAPSPRT